MFWDLLYSVDKYNELRINISEFANTTQYSRQRVTKFLSDAVKIGFMKRISRGVYEVNPFAFKSKGATSAVIESKQNNWERR
jgi:predicted transcriptional regulator of viral defense system